MRERRGVPSRLLKNGVYLRTAIFQYLTSLLGPVAQLIERVVRNDEVVGLIPIWSTTFVNANAAPAGDPTPDWHVAII